MLEDQKTPDFTSGVSCVGAKFYADNGLITPALKETKMIKLENQIQKQGKNFSPKDKNIC